MMGAARGAVERWEKNRAKTAREKEQLGLGKQNVEQKQKGGFKTTELPSNNPEPSEPTQFQQPPPIIDQAINKVSSTPLAPPPSVNSTPTENPYLKKEPVKDVRSEAKEASQKRMSKLWEQKDSSTGEKAKTPDLGETFKGMFGGENAQDAKKQEQAKALKTLLNTDQGTGY